jgi:hypothetical protein
LPDGSEKFPRSAQCAVDQLDADSPLADGGRDALHAIRTDIANREHARLAGLEEVGTALQRPSRLAQFFPEEVVARRSTRRATEMLAPNFCAWIVARAARDWPDTPAGKPR